MVRYRREDVIKQKSRLNKVAQYKTRKHPTNKETDNKVDEKTYLEWLGLKPEIMSSQA